MTPGIRLRREVIPAARHRSLCVIVATIVFVAACGGDSDSSQKQVIDVLEVVVSAAEEDSIACVIASLEESGTIAGAGAAMVKLLAGDELTDAEQVAAFSFGLAVDSCMSLEELDRSEPSPLQLGSEPGDSFLLDTLWSECADGDFSSCDLLFHLADLGSEYESFAASCGDRTQTTGYCFDIYVGAVDISLFRSSCEVGDMKACDLLFFRSLPGSPEEQIGATCGGLNQAGPLRCVQIHGYPPDDAPA